MGKIYVGSLDGYFYCFNPDGSIHWQTATGGSILALKQCQDALATLQGTQEAPFVALLDQIDAKLNELSRLSNQDLYARKAELDSVQTWITNANKQPLSAIQKYADGLKDQQARLDALRKTLEQIIASGEATPTYTVGTWAKDRDCLWNIAKKPKIYDNPFL